MSTANLAALEANASNIATACLAISDAMQYVHWCTDGRTLDDGAAAFPVPHGRIVAYRTAARALVAADEAIREIPVYRDYPELMAARRALRACASVLPDAPEPWRADEPYYGELIETAARFRRRGRIEELARAFDGLMILLDDVKAAVETGGQTPAPTPAGREPVSRADLNTRLDEAVPGIAPTTRAERIRNGYRGVKPIEVLKGKYDPVSVDAFIAAQKPVREHQEDFFNV